MLTNKMGDMYCEHLKQMFCSMDDQVKPQNIREKRSRRSSMKIIMGELTHQRTKAK